MKYIPNGIQFDTQSRSSSLIMTMIFEIPDLDPKLNTCADLVSKLQCARVYEIWHSGQIECTHYEYSIWN